MRHFLPLDIQFFAEETPETPEEPTAAEPEKTPEEPGEDGAQSDEKKFTQADIDRAVKERLAREKKKREQAAEKARLETEREQLAEQEKYRELADNLQKELDQQKSELLEAKRDSMLAAAGYNAEQVDRYRKFAVGDNDEDIAKSIAELVEDIPPKKTYVDPSAGNGVKQTPEPKDAAEKGRQLVRDLIAKGKIRGMKNKEEK